MATQEWEGTFDPLSDPEEREHLLSVLDSFRSYRRLAHFNGTHVRRQAFYSLPQEHWTLLSKPPFSILDSLSHLDDLIDGNAELAEAIFTSGFKSFIAPTISSDWAASIVSPQHAGDEFRVFSTVMDHLNFTPYAPDTDKARSTINQFYRDWTSGGGAERTASFAPIIAALDAEFLTRHSKKPSLQKSDLKILTPGAGLARLLLDIVDAGYSCEGNEISYHSLLASSLVLNHTVRAGQFTLAPFALNGSNHLDRAAQFATFPVPDVHPASVLRDKGERMGMSTGDFCVLYSGVEAKETFDAVATVFFIDTAPNLIRYVETVRNCLNPGGLWINLGPLLWHHVAKGPEPEDGEHGNSHSCGGDRGIADPGSVELTHEEVVKLVEHFGFVVEQQRTDIGDTGYISNPGSMLQSFYRPVFWTARKGLKGEREE